MKTIEIKTKKGTKTVNAIIKGKLAVHLEVIHEDYSDLAKYVVSHIPTGMQIVKCDVSYWKGCPVAASRSESKKTALKLADQLQQFDWNFSDPSAMPYNTKLEAGLIINRFRC